MSTTYKWIGVYGNGALAFLGGVLGLGGLINGEFLLVLIALVVCALAIFNIRVMRWVMGLSAEEEWLQAEVRKAELRQHLAALGEFAHSTDEPTDPSPAQRPAGSTDASA